MEQQTLSAKKQAILKNENFGTGKYNTQKK